MHEEHRATETHSKHRLFRLRTRDLLEMKNLCNGIMATCTRYTLSHQSVNVSIFEAGWLACAVSMDVIASAREMRRGINILNKSSSEVPFIIGGTYHRPTFSVFRARYQFPNGASRIFSMEMFVRPMCVCVCACSNVRISR